MRQAARAFLEGLIDYAGLFPPARLELEPALRNYARYRDEAEAFMLARFIIPSPRLTELEAFGEDPLARGEPWRLSVLARAAPDWEGLEDALGATLQETADCERTLRERVEAEVFELRLPGPVAGQQQRLGRALAAAREERPRAQFFVEAPIGGMAADGAAREIAALLAVIEPAGGAGLKLRCGGVTADLYPKLPVVVAALAGAVRSGVPFKATAGLHHPLFHRREDLAVDEFGFLGLFGAGVLLAAGAIEEGQLAEVLCETSATAFAFDGGTMRWRGCQATLAQITEARRKAVLSFGSCSFDEPRDDLRQMKILPADAATR